MPGEEYDDDESILDPCGFQIQQRKWERFTNPIQAVGHLMAKEFYANAWEPDKEKWQPYTYTTMVRGKDISFAPRNIKRVLKLRKDPLPNAASYHERKANKDYRLEHVLEDLCIERADWVRHKDGRPHYLRRADLEPMTKALCADAKIPTIKDDTLIPQEPSIMGVAMTRTRETRARNTRQARQEAPPQQQPPQEQPQREVHHQQDFPPNFYTHFDASMSQIYRRLDQQQEESRKSFEAINTRMDRMDDQISFLCYSNQMAIHRQKEEEMNQERMRYDQILQEAVAQQAREANRGQAREVVPDSEEKEDSEEMALSASEEW
ncbi:hypothetical protein PIB30_073512 [Stylosanthes scabra]|uniref:Putative plant transposon protein domain-containing protein n=1 Tax=Stylosanthes scabra TaxID=79078 RepID=A0ABU6XPP4_9FABA|nr:hypothetical protein [Stylosanthes scabra]